MTALRLPSPRRPGRPAGFEHWAEMEKAVMQTAVHSNDSSRGDQIRFYAAFGAAYPLFLASEAAQRLFRRAPRSGAESSVFVAARENAFIAISYALMARTTLQTFARQNRAERLS